MDTNTDHFTPLAQHMWGNETKLCHSFMMRAHFHLNEDQNIKSKGAGVMVLISLMSCMDFWHSQMKNMKKPRNRIQP